MQGELFGRSLAAARTEYWSAVEEEGANCPCCERFGRIYKRKLNSAMAWFLVSFYRQVRLEGPLDGWVHVTDFRCGRLKAHHAEYPKLAYWGLLEERQEPREEGHDSGWWRLTGLGVAFVRREATVQSHALVYDAGCRGLAGTQIDIEHALGEHFDWHELMGEYAK